MNLPESVVHWGHPLMMGIVIFVMGSFVGWAGWRGRLATDGAIASKFRASHRQLAPWMFFFLAAGYTGGVLALVMKHQPILESPHFWTGSVVLALLTVNAVLAIRGFWAGKENTEGQQSLRKIHAYLGSMALSILFIHAFLGLKLGLSI